MPIVGAKRMITAILIDPFACTVSEVEYDGDDHHQIYPLISHETMKVDCFTCAYSPKLEEGDAVYVDDEGLFKKPERFFLLPGNPQPLAGKGLVVGADDEGESTSVKTKLETLQDGVFFLEANDFVQDSRLLTATVEPWVKRE